MNIRRTALCGAAIILTAGALTACSIGSQKEQPATYDLGVPRNHPVSGSGMTAIMVLPDISAPEWLNGNGIVYRLNYENASRPQAYALSRWTAAPSALLTQRVRSRFAAAAANGIVTTPDGVRADYLLRVDLEDFSQSFDAPNSSRVALRARASLINLANRTLVAQRVFAVEHAAPTPDAPGAVQALSTASEEFVESLLNWTDERLKSAKGK